MDVVWIRNLTVKVTYLLKDIILVRYSPTANNLPKINHNMKQYYNIVLLLWRPSEEKNGSHNWKCKTQALTTRHSLLTLQQMTLNLRLIMKITNKENKIDIITNIDGQDDIFSKLNREHLTRSTRTQRDNDTNWDC